MEITGSGKPSNSALSFRYNANNEELEELFQSCDPEATPQQGDQPTKSETASPKKAEKTSSIIDKYFKSMRSEKSDKAEDVKSDPKPEETKSSTPKEVSSSPMKEYLNRLGKRSTSESSEIKEPNETWKIFHDFKFKIAQAVEDMKTRSLEENKEKSIARDNSTSDSEENSAVKDLDQQSVGDTDNQVSSLDSSIQNLSEVTQPITAKVVERENHNTKDHSESSDDTHKNLRISETDISQDVLNDNGLEVESGVEALEDTIDAFGDMSSVDYNRPVEQGPPTPISTPANFGLPPSKSNLPKVESQKKPKSILNFTMYFLTVFLIVNYLLFPNCNVWNGFLLGLWFFCLVSNVKQWVLDTYFSEWEPSSNSFFQLKRSSTIPLAYTIPSVKEHTPLKKYEGWINHYRFPDYDPFTYHINKTTTAFMKLEGCNLRISYTRTKIAKRALWDEKIEKVNFYQHRLYNLTGARVILLPKGLVKRRQWSKKYPICIILSEKEKIQVLEKENSTEKKVAESLEKKSKDTPLETESAETNTSPERKKKFVWRRREKSISHEPEPGREGLRHRLVRKMHRDKKTDSVSTLTDPESETATQVQSDKTTQEDEELAKTTSKDEEDEIDDTELSKIKEFLEETESDPIVEGTTEGEWSVHVKPSKDKHSHLYLFARTGRDKHEWYRQIMTAISEANSADTSTEEKSEPQENKDGIEMAVYKVTDKETVAFGKTKGDSTSEMSVTPTHAPAPSLQSYDKTFWPYILKIMQTHEVTSRQTSDVGVMCQLEPSPHERNKTKKKKKDSQQSSDCECRTLPAEVTWVNTMLARVMYDMMRDPVLIARLQNKIQRKLNTLKLPSFMSPLLVTELSLSGSCPLVCGVRAPACDARGVWLDAHLRYDGGAHIAIQTQINLMKLKEKNLTLEEHMLETNEGNIVENEINITSDSNAANIDLRKRKPAIYDSEMEDSAESSSDEETPPAQPLDSADNILLPENAPSVNSPEGGSSKKKFLRMVDKIATNKYFQQVTDYKYVKRAMEGLSNTDIKLQLEVHGLEGRLALNLPPPPHDRIWIGFRTNPQLVLKARPAFGARTLRFAHISNWIEQKLTKEFEKVLVLPNMEDFVLDIMTPTPVEFE